MALYFLHESLKFIRIIRERIGMPTLPRPLPSSCLIGLLDGFPYCCTGEFIRFSICSTKAETLPSYAASASSDLESRDSKIVLLNFGGILQEKTCHAMEYAYLNIQNKNMYRCSAKMCPIGRARNMFWLDFGPKHTEARKLVNAWMCQEIIVFSN